MKLKLQLTFRITLNNFKQVLIRKNKVMIWVLVEQF